ncbi:hypothetical protein [Nocardia sp. NPDC051570]
MRADNRTDGSALLFDDRDCNGNITRVLNAHEKEEHADFHGVRFVR